MTTDQAPPPADADEDVLLFAGGTPRDKSNDHVAFRLAAADEDGEVVESPFVYRGHRPKMRVLLRLAAVMDDDTNPVKQALALDDLLERILDEPSIDELHRRLDDPDDDLDYDNDTFLNAVRGLVGLWYERPTGKRPASRGSQSRTGRRSTVRARSRG